MYKDYELEDIVLSVRADEATGEITAILKAEYAVDGCRVIKTDAKGGKISGGKWVTMNGTPVYIKGGKFVTGPMEGVSYTPKGSGAAPKASTSSLHGSNTVRVQKRTEPLSVVRQVSVLKSYKNSKNSKGIQKEAVNALGNDIEGALRLARSEDGFIGGMFQGPKGQKYAECLTEMTGQKYVLETVTNKGFMGYNYSKKVLFAK